MTGCRKLAPVSALALAALAASATNPLPQARAASDEASEAGRGTGPAAGPAAAGYVELQRQVNELRSELLDQRERTIDRRQQANGIVLVVLGIVIGVGGLWFSARLRAIAAQARIGEAVARGYVPASHGLLSGAGTSQAPPGEQVHPLGLLDGPGPEADSESVARASGNGRASSVAAPRPQALGNARPADGLGSLAGPALRAPDDERQRGEEAIADCTEAIRLDPRNPRLYLERAGVRSQLARHEEAISDYDRAIQLDPDLVEACLGRCHAKSELGRHEEAVEDYDHLARLDPDLAAAVVDG